MSYRSVYRLKAGNINRLKTSQEAIIDVGPKDVLISVKAIGLNFADVFAVMGLYSATPEGAFIPGLEFSGVIEALGPEVEGFEIGNRIMGVTRFGAYASHVTINYNYIIPLDDQWTFQEGAAYLVQCLTAYYALKCLGDIKEKRNILIHSAAGGVGIWANRIAKAYNAFTIGTVGNATKLETLRIEGYDEGLIRDPKSFKKDLRQILGVRPLHLIMECIGGSVMQDGYDLLAPMGRTLVYGSAHYGDRTDRPNYLKLGMKYIRRPRIDPQKMIAENKSVRAFNLIYLFDNVILMHELLQELKELNLGRPIVGEEFQFEDLPKAIRTFQSGQTIGKLVINI